MANSAVVVVTSEKYQIGQGPKLRKISVAWLSDDGDGSVDLPIATELGEDGFGKLLERCGKGRSPESPETLVLRGESRGEWRR